jgi:hypothetical protein
MQPDALMVQLDRATVLLLRLRIQAHERNVFRQRVERLKRRLQTMNLRLRLLVREAEGVGR